MRFAIQIRPLALGLLIVVSQSLLATMAAAAWNLPGFGSREEPAMSGGAVRGTGGTAVVPRNAYPPSGHVVQQAYAEGLPATGAIQQTAHTGPSRGGTLLGGNSLFGDSGGIPFSTSQPATQATGKKGPTWRGHELRLPTNFFGRNGNSARSKVPTPTASNIRRQAAAPAGRMAANVLPANSASPQPGVTAGRRAMSNPQLAARSRSFVPTQQLPTADTRSQTAAAPASFAKPPHAAPIHSTPSDSPEPSTAPLQPKTAADRLIMQAHDQSAKAQGEGDFTRIIETCRRARASQPSPPLNEYANQLAAWSFNRRGQIRAEGGRLQEAMLDFEDAIRANPKLWRALHNRGVLRAQAGDYEQAFDDFNLTIEYNPEYAKAYSNRAALFVVAGDLSAALDDYGTAIELDPNLAVAHRGRGRVCHLLGQLDEALDHYDAAVQLAPQDAYALSSRADLLTDLGRYAEAAAGYEQAIHVDSRFAGAYRGSAWLLATSPDSSVRNADLAVERAQSAIELDGHEDAVSYDTLAAAQASAGDFTAALHTLRQAIEIAPDDEREVYQDRLKLYQRAKPYRISPLREVAQASYEESY